ncbi:hypothetical protein H4Q26_012241 [Puccinia striiformis f. sp. tritici PST-130]|nr:hypothetical protein H4Q26_012241 [Puccinia striiformis f. sp. tritici PST-130]
MEEPAETLKVLAICKSLNSTPAKITPKRFFEIFLASNNSEIVYLRRLWAQPTGLDSTMRLLPSSATKCSGLKEGKMHGLLLFNQKSTEGVYPRGSFLSSLAVHRAFFTPEVQQNQDTARTTTHMPFLYGLIMGMFHKRGLSSDTFEDENARESANVHNDLEGVVGDQVPEMYGEVAFVKLLTGKEQAFARCSRGHHEERD